MGNAKYIVNGCDVIIFPSSFDHAATCNNLFGNTSEVKGAGFIKFDGDGGVECYGRSESLEIDSRGELDTVLAKITLGINR